MQSHKTQLLVTALASSLATATLVSAYTHYLRRKRRAALNQDVSRSLKLAGADNDSIDVNNSDIELHTSVQPQESLMTSTVLGGLGTYDEDLVREQLARNYAFFGEESMRRVRGASVVVVGCGGVGSWAAVMLVRSGISKIRLVDFDYVTLSSLNRHATAGLADVGTPKVKCIERALRQFARWVEVDCRIEVWRKEEGGKLLEGADWIIDAIDNITTKVDLLKYCHDHNLKVFSSMGAGAKCDPTRVQISDIANTMYDPLARVVRRRLRILGVPSGIPVVYSTEVPGEVSLLPLPEEEFQKGNVKELGVFDDFRVRILPVLGPLPSIFALHIATYVLCEIARKPIPNPLPIKNRRKLYERLLRDFQRREGKRTGQLINKMPLDEDDVALIFEDIHRGRSVIPPHAVPTRPALVRWDFAAPLVLENCVVMEIAEAEQHEREVALGRLPGEVWGPEVERLVNARAQEVRQWRDWVGP